MTDKQQMNQGDNITITKTSYGYQFGFHMKDGGQMTFGVGNSARSFDELISIIKKVIAV